MPLNLALSAAGLGVGFLVGLTGMGGGALLTPLLILVFGVSPLAAVSSDLATSLVMKPVGAAVHVRRGTVDWRLVRRLSAGAAPSAFAGVLLLRALGGGPRLHHDLQDLIGGVLLLSLVAMTASASLRRGRRTELVGTTPAWRTVAVGTVGGLCVGTTSVGAGSVIIALLLATHPGLRMSRLVGTDLVQAIPLVAAATAGHLLFGDVRLALTASLLVGAVPGTYLGARLSAHAPIRLLRPAVVTLVLASALALVHLPGVVVVATTVTAMLLWTSQAVRTPTTTRS